MKNQYDSDVRRLEKRLCKRNRLIAGLRIRIIKNRDMWFEQTEILEKDMPERKKGAESYGKTCVTC